LWTSRLKLYDKHYPRWKVSLARKIIRMGMNRAIKHHASEPALMDAYRQVIELTKK
jgi:hypothetical protein